MKAAVIEKAKEIRLMDVPLPVLEDGETLIRVKFCGVCGSDIHIQQGHHPTAKFPVIPGHEFVGEFVEAKGKGADRFQKGDLVVAQPYYSCGYCEACAKGHDNVCTSLQFMGAHRNGGFAEYVKVLTRKTYALPKGLDPQLASLIEPLAVAVHDVRRSGLQVGETALVVGGGPIGILIALVARDAGARKVVIFETNDFRRKFARELGFEAINPLADDFEKQILPAAKKGGYHVSYEVSGTQAGINAAIKYTKTTGTVMVIGIMKDLCPINLSDIFAKELRLEGVRIHEQYHYVGAIELMRTGKLDKELHALISKRYTLNEIEEAFAFSMVPGDYFKVLVEI
ncbi:MAG: alcohol dehydrogenase catalytic domain-containing protein [Lachnospiraceae bacterium]|nr:alcohol dehydrogenase catalytic domain-containing protein [Lachnospiraceae bacterium]